MLSDIWRVVAIVCLHLGKAFIVEIMYYNISLRVRDVSLCTYQVSWEVVLLNSL